MSQVGSVGGRINRRFQEIQDVAGAVEVTGGTRVNAGARNHGGDLEEMCSR